MDSFLTLKQRVQALFDENPIEEHIFVKSMQHSQLHGAQVKELALQMYHVVHHFPRFLAAILTQMPEYRLRMPLVENLYEEHGKMNSQFVHVETYMQFLTGIGITQAELTASQPSIPVLAYNRAITDLCLHHPYEEGLAALGVIEEIVARVSPFVSRYIHAHYQHAQEMMIHFADHETLDIQHADEIYEVVAHFYADERMEHVEKGLRLGLYYHHRLYTDLWALLINH